jgi:glucose-1-phosphate cytidylyltransferase
MKVVILAGGKGTRLSEETVNIPKPMIEIGGKPILWHIMKIYSHYGFNEFIICCGYKGYLIKEYFANYFLHQSDITIDLSTGNQEIHSNNSENWKVTLVDTGLETKTARRIKHVLKYIGKSTFMLTYGDGLSNVNLEYLLNFHLSKKSIITITSTQPSGRFGAININKDDQIVKFHEKPKEAWINSGFMVCEPEIVDYLEIAGHSMLEDAPFFYMVKDKKMCAYRYDGWFSPMDTLRDMHELNDLWNGCKAPWKVW